LRDSASRAITEVALAGTLLREFNETSFSLLSDDPQAGVAAGGQLAMIVDGRVGRVRDFSKLREAQEEILVGYLGNPAPSSVVIFIADELDKRKKITKFLLTKSPVVIFLLS